MVLVVGMPECDISVAIIPPIRHPDEGVADTLWLETDGIFITFAVKYFPNGHLHPHPLHIHRIAVDSAVLSRDSFAAVHAMGSICARHIWHSGVGAAL